jgi:molecular chaperone HscB
MGPCPSCGAKLETPLGCGSCGALLSPPAPPSPFEAFDLEPAYALEISELERRLRRFGRVLHPDYFAADEAKRALAERNSAALNEAYETLADPAARADWLVRWLGGPSEGERREMPKAFLMEVLEWNEAIEAAEGAAGGAARRAALGDLTATLREHRAEVLAAVERLLTPLPARGDAKLAEVRAQLNALRYLDNALARIAALELEQAAGGRG